MTRLESTGHDISHETSGDLGSATGLTDTQSEDLSLLILYGSVTGNAQDVAERIGREAMKRGVVTRLMAMDAYPLESLIDETLVVFVCSTTGDGVEPANMTSLWRALLRSDLPTDLLDHLRFAVFGLGDSAYQHFNWAAKKLQRRLLSLGGIEISRRGDADDQDYYGIDDGLNPWMVEVFDSLSGFLSPHTRPVEEIEALLLRPRVKLLQPNPNDELAPRTSELSVHDTGRFWVTVTQNKRITRSDWYQDVRHLELSTDFDIQYEPGDVAVIYPENSDNDVGWLIQRMHWEADADRSFYIEPTDQGWPLDQGTPRISTIRNLLKRHLDISAIPRRSFFEVIRRFASDEREREKLEEFCSKEGQDDLHSYTTRPRRTALEVLTEFRSVAIPLSYIFDAFSTLRPRQFSIASAISVHPRTIQLCVAVVKYRSILKTPRKGVCTAWLAGLPEGSKFQISLAPGTMKLPIDRDTPVVMIGPGTGVAPLRAFLEERTRQNAKDNTLYFGCRSIKADCHYQSEWEGYSARGELTYEVAASRDQESKVYVQHLLERSGHLLVEKLVKKQGHLYICGSSNQMPKAVRKAIETALALQDGWSAEDAAEYVKIMAGSGRWGEECW